MDQLIVDLLGPEGMWRLEVYKRLVEAGFVPILPRRLTNRAILPPLPPLCVVMVAAWRSPKDQVASQEEANVRIWCGAPDKLGAPEDPVLGLVQCQLFSGEEAAIEETVERLLAGELTRRAGFEQVWIGAAAQAERPVAPVVVVPWEPRPRRKGAAST